MHTHIWIINHCLLYKRIISIWPLQNALCYTRALESKTPNLQAKKLRHSIIYRLDFYFTHGTQPPESIHAHECASDKK